MGARYCIKPITDSGRRLAAAPKNSSGIEVTAPAIRSNAVCHGPSVPRVSPLVKYTHTNNPIAVSMRIIRHNYGASDYDYGGYANCRRHDYCVYDHYDS